MKTRPPSTSPLRPFGRRSLLMLLLVGAIVGACGGGAAGPTGTPPRATSAGGATNPASTAAPITDLCGLVGAAAVSAAIGEPVTGGTTETTSGSTMCDFTTASGTTVSLGVTPNFTSLNSWDSQMRSLGMTDANKIPGIGEAAYAKAGLLFGDPGASFSAYQDHTGIDVTIASIADPAALVAAATAIGKILFEAVF